MCTAGHLPWAVSQHDYDIPISTIASYHAHIAAWLAVAVTYITCDIGGPEIQAFQIATVAASMLQDYAGYQRLSGIENWDSNPR